MVANERIAEAERGNYLYSSEERSERTGGHLWTERVAETNAGKLRYLVAEDGQLLSPERQAEERKRLKDIAEHPDVFAKHEQSRKNDEHHAHDMLELLPKAFLFDAPVKEGEYTRLHFRPDPKYQPQSLEERILRSMTGSVLIGPTERLHALDGRLAEDVDIGFGIIGTVKAGSGFAITRDHEPGDEWKTTLLDTDVNGRIIFFKTIGRKEHAVHSNFRSLPKEITVPQAVEAAEK